jgi:hypothetical protein
MQALTNQLAAFKHLTALVQNMPQTECQVNHKFSAGVYLREILIPKNTLRMEMWKASRAIEKGNDVHFVDFTYSNQPAREMHIGGAVGSMSHGISDSGHDHLTGSIHTVAQYTSNLSQSDRQRVEGIMAWNYGIQSVLPANHPFKNAAP